MDELKFFDALATEGYVLNDHQRQLCLMYLDLILKYNSVMDLTANDTKESILEKNFFDSIISLSNYDYENKSLIDVGSGAGFPGILYAIVCPNLKVTLLEPMQKRVMFLNVVKETLKLDNVEVICARAEDFAKNNREKFDYASARGVAKLNILLELIIPLLKVQGIFIALKGKKAFEEENEAQNACKILDAKRICVKEFLLPTNKETRINLYYQKTGVSNQKYPRNYGNIKKKPL